MPLEFHLFSPFLRLFPGMVKVKPAIWHVGAQSGARVFFGSIVFFLEGFLEAQEGEVTAFCKKVPH
jgi:hypothetical protein